MRRTRRGNKPDRIELTLFTTLLGQDKMAVVNRIEGAAKNSESHYHSSPHDRVHDTRFEIGHPHFETDPPRQTD